MKLWVILWKLLAQQLMKQLKGSRIFLQNSLCQISAETPEVHSIRRHVNRGGSRKSSGGGGDIWVCYENGKRKQDCLRDVFFYSGYTNKMQMLILFYLGVKQILTCTVFILNQSIYHPKYKEKQKVRYFMIY